MSADVRVMRFAGALALDRAPELAASIEQARQYTGPLVLDFADATSVDAMVAMDVMLFLRRRLRHGMPFAVVLPRVNPEWIARSESLAGATMCRTLDEALQALSG